MNDIWNEICTDLQDCIRRDVLEKEYENTIANCMRFLNWRKSEGEITTQYPIQVGHETKLADIVVSSDGIEQFVIEVKRPNHCISQEDRKQLLSYMRMLKHPVKFGIYIGENIRLFYDDLTSEPTEICTIDISPTDPNGAKFVDLCHKNTYNPQAILDFYEDLKRKQAEEQQKQEAINSLRNSLNSDVVKEALKEKYLREGYTEDVIADVFGQIDIHVTPHNSCPDTPANVSIPTPIQNIRHAPATQNSVFDTTHYTISGGAPLNKRQFVFEVVKRFVQQHPMTYKEYVQIFNTLPGLKRMIRTLDEVQGTNYWIRYFTEERKRLRSTDGITFVVYNQWGIFNINTIVDFANKQGYNVEIIRD